MKFGLWEILLILPLLAIYLIPLIIALVRNTKNRTGIILLSILAGWTFIGWVAALVWAITDKKAENNVRVDGASPPADGYCRNCGSRVSAQDVYCPKCGSKLG